jgi:hypothetical protein
VSGGNLDDVAVMDRDERPPGLDIVSKSLTAIVVVAGFVSLATKVMF